MTHADLVNSQWQTHVDQFGEASAAVYTSADGTATDIDVIVNGRPESQNLNDSWETVAKQYEIFAAVSVAPSAYTPDGDTITVRGEVYTVMERVNVANAQYRYLCELTELQTVEHRGRFR
jgi:hypothetical protein